MRKHPIIVTLEHADAVSMPHVPRKQLFARPDLVWASNNDCKKEMQNYVQFNIFDKY